MPDNTLKALKRKRERLELELRDIAEDIAEMEAAEAGEAAPVEKTGKGSSGYADE